MSDNTDELIKIIQCLNDVNEILDSIDGHLSYIAKEQGQTREIVESILSEIRSKNK